MTGRPRASASSPRRPAAAGAWVAACLLLGAAPAAAQAPEVQVQPERSVVSVGEPFWVTITVQSETGGASVSLPPGSPFELVQHGGTSSSFQIRSGFGMGTQISRTETTRWQVRALRVGRHLLGPLAVSQGGQQHMVGAATIEVHAGGAPLPPSPPPAEPSPWPFPGLPQPGGALPPGFGAEPAAPPEPGELPGRIDPSELDGAVYDPELFVRTVVEPSEAYVGQQVVMTVYLYTTLNLSNVNVTREPSTDGFWSEDLLGPTRRLEFEDQIIGSSRFRFAALRRLALFPLREGRLTIGAPQLEARTVFTSLFSPRAGTVSRSGQEVHLRVRPLPSKGRPAEFQPGNVGRFTITSSVDRDRAALGEPVTLTVRVRGEGNLRNVKISPLGEVAGARVYEPRVRDSVAAGSGSKVVAGERSWEYLVLPQEAGALELPAASISFFDPVTAEYRAVDSGPVRVEVTGSAAARPSPAAEAGRDRTEGADEEVVALRTIRRRASLATSARPLQATWWFVLAVAVPPVGFLLLVGLQAARRRRDLTREAARARGAAAAARKALRRAPGEGGDREVVRALGAFLSDRFGLTASGLTSDELRSGLVELGAGEELAGQVADLLEGCERARYAPGGGSGGDGRELASRAAGLVDELDRLRAGSRGRPGEGRQP